MIYRTLIGSLLLTALSAAQAADTQITRLDQAELACESETAPMGPCIQQKILASALAQATSAQSVAMMQQVTIESFDAPPFQQYFRWLAEYATPLPAQGDARAQVLRLIRARTQLALWQQSVATLEDPDMVAAGQLDPQQLAQALAQSRAQLAQAQAQVQANGGPLSTPQDLALPPTVNSLQQQLAQAQAEIAQLKGQQQALITLSCILHVADSQGILSSMNGVEFQYSVNTGQNTVAASRGPAAPVNVQISPTLIRFNQGDYDITISRITGNFTMSLPNNPFPLSGTCVPADKAKF